MFGFSLMKILIIPEEIAAHRRQEQGEVDRDEKQQIDRPPFPDVVCDEPLPASEKRWQRTLGSRINPSRDHPEAMIASG